MIRRNYSFAAGLLRNAEGGSAAAGGADAGAAAPGEKETILGGAADAGAAGAASGAAAAGTDAGAAGAAAGADKGADAAAADWRVKMAGEDKDFLKRLGRFSDEAAFAKSYRSLEQKLSSGEFKKALPETATDEERATWRKENGLPEAADGYVEKLALPNGLVLGEADKPIVSEFAKAAYDGNVAPDQFNKLVAKYYEIQEAQKVAQEAADDTFRQESEEALRAEWEGPNYRRNLTAVRNMMSGWPEGLADRVLAGRTPDGRKLGDDPAFIKQLATLAVEINPIATLLPAGTADPGKTAQAELDSIRELRRNDPNKYDADKKLQQRELELIEALQKVATRAA
jgi:hypothetical protein